MVEDHTAMPVVVGVDGSRAAVAAAQWGAGEAFRRAVPLRLLYVIDCNRGYTRDVVNAQSLVARAALQDARTAVESTHTPIKIELESTHGDPGTVLTDASCSAVLMCLGSPKAAPHGPRDSLAANMAASAHCSVVVVPATQYSDPARSGCCIAALVDSSTNDYDVLEQAMEEAQLRELPLHVVTMLRRISPELARNRDSKEASQVTAGVEESLVDWSRYYPGIEIHMEQTDQFVKYALEHQRSIRLVVVGAEHHDEVAQLIEMTRPRVLHDASFSVFVIRNQHP